MTPRKPTALFSNFEALARMLVLSGCWNSKLKGMWITLIFFCSSLLHLSYRFLVFWMTKKTNNKKQSKTEYKLPIIERKMTQAGTVYTYAHMQLINVLTKALLILYNSWYYAYGTLHLVMSCFMNSLFIIMHTRTWSIDVLTKPRDLIPVGLLILYKSWLQYQVIIIKHMSCMYVYFETRGVVSRSQCTPWPV